jgi:Domain of unknown function (DUF4468) with TBP-like fold
MKLLTTLFLFLFLIINGQDRNLINYSEVIKVDSTRSAKDLYAQAKMFFVDTFKNSKAVIQLEDSSNNTIIGEGKIPYKSRYLIGSGTTVGSISFRISIACKDGRYKYDIGNFNHEGKSISFGYIDDREDPENKFGPTGTRIKVYKEMKELIASKIDPLVVYLKEYMGQKKTTNSQDW